MQKPYQFVGGPYDGKHLVVPGPTEIGLELRVYPIEPWLPGTSYLLGTDGRFRIATSDRELYPDWTSRHMSQEHSVAS